MGSKIKWILFFIATFFCGKSIYESYAKYALEKETFEQNEALIQETNACIENRQWNCAEKNIKILLQKTPHDTNLKIHLAGILLEKGEYDECLNYIETLDFENKNLVHFKEKAHALKREMQELGIEKSMHFQVEFDGTPDKAKILETLSVLEIAYDSLCTLFQFFPEEKFPVVLYQSEIYQGIGNRPDWVGALFDGKLRIPLNTIENRNVYRPILFHELTHAFIRSMNNGKIPLWVNEGIAQVLDGSHKKRPEGARPQIKELTENFVNENDSEKAKLLYWYSQKMVELLLQKSHFDFILFKNFVIELNYKNIDNVLQKYYKCNTNVLLNEVESDF